MNRYTLVDEVARQRWSVDDADVTRASSAPCSFASYESVELEQLRLALAASLATERALRARLELVQERVELLTAE